MPSGAGRQEPTYEVFPVLSTKSKKLGSQPFPCAAQHLAALRSVFLTISLDSQCQYWKQEYVPTFLLSSPRWSRKTVCYSIQKTHKVMQIHSFKSSCSLPRSSKCAYLKSRQVSERRLFAEATCAPPSSQWPNAQAERAGTGPVDARVLRVCRKCFNAQRVILN